jgi:hypothetical protein
VFRVAAATALPVHRARLFGVIEFLQCVTDAVLNLFQDGSKPAEATLVAQRFGNARPGETPSPLASDDLDRGPHAHPPATETEFRLTGPFPKRFANFGNESERELAF